ncbi:MAG: 16S rRNA (cytidine(1402)-2'-O)-methyltransferase, partial [Alphaproteobacteria bacterium]|nr:16S rRNA (cytidine(1402)-2'-O)-methyltransferase [Alphaproteobacteria bacterium]
EMVVLIAPPLKPAPALLDDETILAALETASLRDVVQTLMAQTGLPRKAIYQRTLDLSQKKKT